MIKIILTNPTTCIIIIPMKTFKGGIAMRTIKLATYLRKADREYERTKQAIGEQKMIKYRIDYDFILYLLFKKEERPFKLEWKGRTYEIWTEEDLERTLLIINY
jgi:hypothetical protein